MDSFLLIVLKHVYTTTFVGIIYVNVCKTHLSDINYSNRSAGVDSAVLVGELLLLR